MCQLKDCQSICYYELDDYGTKVYIHYDKCYNPIWIEYCKNGVSLGEYWKKEKYNKVMEKQLELEQFCMR